MARTWRDDEDIVRQVQNRNGSAAAMLMSDDDYGQTLYNSKLWETADASGRAALHDANEGIKNRYGYSGGVDGSQYIKTNPSTVQDWQQKMYSYSQYLNPYQDQIGQKVDAITNRGPFNYNLDTDPAWQAYQKQYTREGQRAYDDALAKLSARTGGLASSYAGQQAQQTYGNYMQAMTDKIPELYKLAYDMYSSDAARDLNDLNALRQLGSDARAEWLDNYNLLGNNLGLAQNERAYQDAKDASMLYAYGDGAPYEIGSGKGQYFVLNAAPGSTMTGDDGSQWTKNADGSVTITKDGQTWTVAGPAPTYTGGPGRRGSDEEEEEGIDAEGAANDTVRGALVGALAGWNGGPRGEDSLDDWRMMTQSEWNRRKASYDVYGTGGAEVSNYDSYDEYVDAYRKWIESQK